MGNINPGLSPQKATCSRACIHGVLRVWSFVALFFAKIAIPVLTALVLVPVGLRSALADEDPRDRTYVMEQVNQALETQKTKVETRWSNPETGNWGIIVIERTFYSDTGEPCRDYMRTVDKSGARPLVVNGTGCRVGPARWEIKEDTPPPSRTSPTTTTDKKEETSGPVPATEKTTAPATVPSPKPTKRATATKTAACPDPAPPAPPFTVVKAPCGRPPAFTDFTLPSKAQL